ncbi:MAG: hypothetical protein K2X39_09615 [Silvanigrellaceae bacterium]|nr:hypothetical protein [Silvanigrellaceae bacterium]
MILTLTFDDNKEGELEKFEMMSKSRSFHGVISEVLQMIRKECKYNEPSDERKRVFEEIHEFIWDQINQGNLEQFF